MMTNESPGIIYRFFAFIGRVLKSLLKSVMTLFISVLVLVLVVSIVAAIIARPEPVPDKAALHIAPQGAIVEQLSYVPPLARVLDNDAQRETLLRNLTDTIKAAAKDERITALVLDLNHLNGASLPQLEELSLALVEFKKSNKPVVAMADNFNQTRYYLASHADNIYLNPFGAIEITGFGTFRPYFKDALDKLKINMHVFKVGSYKDAVEPFTRSGMSEASRQHNSEWINSLWKNWTGRVEARRGLAEGTIDKYIETIDTELIRVNGDAAQLALETGLVDGLKTRSQMHEALVELAGSNRNGGYNRVSFKRYLLETQAGGMLSRAFKHDKIAVVVAKGTILDGEQPVGTIGGDSLARLLRHVREDETVDALVFRVDSPGGSANASEIIRQEILQIQEKGIPVVVSMGTYAASGGYWISASADEIWASPTTLTGSIGVFGMLPTFEKSLAELGINVEGVRSTDMAGFGIPVMPLDDKATKVIQAAVDGIYQKFLKLVAAGRDSTPESVHKIAQGRVWTGARAHELGLVDNLGGLQDAITAAAKMADIKDYKVEYVEKPLSFSEKLMRELSNGAVQVVGWFGVDHIVSSNLLTKIRKVASPLTTALQNLNDPNGYYLQCYDCVIN